MHWPTTCSTYPLTPLTFPVTSFYYKFTSRDWDVVDEGVSVDLLGVQIERLEDGSICSDLCFC